jgi:malonyl-CoA O-methyltransferase
LSFSKYANSYGEFSVIQKIVAKACVNEIVKYENANLHKKKVYNILDIGCGSGFVYKNIKKFFDDSNIKFNFYGVDDSANMLKLHPKQDNIHLHKLSFDNKEFIRFLNKNKFDYILSSSALQWSKNLDDLLEKIQKTNPKCKFSFGLFSSNTFKTIFNITKTKSPILGKNKIYEVFKNYNLVTHNYNLEFDNKKTLFNYIKQSGVSGSFKKDLKYKKAKELYKKYDINYLEFECVYVDNL